MSTIDVGYERIERTERPIIDEIYDDTWVVIRIEVTRFQGLYLVDTLTCNGERGHYAWQVVS